MEPQVKTRNTETFAIDTPSGQVPAISSPARLAVIEQPRAYPPKIAKALLAITREVGTIKKGGWNNFHKYYYQTWEDVLDTLSPLLATHGLIVMQSEITRGLFDNDKMLSITYEFTIVNDDGDAWPERMVKTAIARLVDSKGTADDKAANKCHTAAQKYFFLQLFKIKTRDAATDDADRGEETGRQTPKAPNPNAAPAEVPKGPRAIPTESITLGAFADEYVKGVTSADNMEVVSKWESLNETALGIVKEKRAELFDWITAHVAAHITKFQPQQQMQAERPKAPNPDSAPAGEQEPSWRQKTYNAIADCKDAGSIYDVEETIKLEEGKVPPADWEAVQAAIKQAKQRIALQT
jgi:hypothetical protein